MPRTKGQRKSPDSLRRYRLVDMGIEKRPQPGDFIIWFTPKGHIRRVFHIAKCFISIRPGKLAKHGAPVYNIFGYDAPEQKQYITTRNPHTDIFGYIHQLTDTATIITCVPIYD